MKQCAYRIRRATEADCPAMAMAHRDSIQSLCSPFCFPEVIANAVIFLVSEQGGWLTGQLLYVGGGYRMHQ